MMAVINKQNLNIEAKYEGNTQIEGQGFADTNNFIHLLIPNELKWQTVKCEIDVNNNYTLIEDENIINNLTPIYVEQIRILRNKMLSLCDFSQLDDFNVNKAAWTTYRQELRDLPTNITNVFHVEWPTPPSLPIITGINYQGPSS